MLQTLQASSPSPTAGMFPSFMFLPAVSNTFIQITVKFEPGSRHTDTVVPTLPPDTTYASSSSGKQ